MLGAIIGDIMGSAYEFSRKKFYASEVNTFPLFIEGTHFTDDSVTSAAIAEWLMDGEQGPEVYLRKFGAKYIHRGYGQMFASWIENPNMGPYNSWGNGSAMRVAAVGHYADTEEECLRLAEQSAVVTHNHPDGIKGAQATAMAIFLARNKKSKDEIRQYLRDKFGYPLNRTIDEIRPTYKWDVSCKGTVPPAIICALESNSFEETIRKAISLGGDADTLAAIAGSIAEPLYGIPDEIVAKAMEYLDPDMVSSLTRFYYFLKTF